VSVELRKRDLDDPAPAALVADPAAYIFQQPAWARILATLGHSVAYYCLEEGGRVLAAQPAAELRLGLFRLLYAGLPYGGPVGDAARFDEYFARLADFARAEGIHRVRASRNFFDAPFAPEGWRVQEHAQHVLSFGGRSEEEVWRGFKGRVRRDVRIAEKAGAVIETASDPAKRDALFALHAQTMARNETFVFWTRGMIEEVWRGLIEPGGGEMLLIRHEGEPLGGLISLYSGRRCFYFLGASGGRKRNLCSNDAVLWEAMRRALARGCEDFDFMISSRQDQRLIDFKEKWGAVCRPFHFHERDVRPVACRLWDAALAAARTRPGAWLLRLVRR